MKVLETWLDGSVGEARLALVDGGRPIALALWRATDPGQRARWGEVYAGRVTQVDRRRRGAFLDIGLRGGAAGFLPLDAQGGVRESGKSRPVREGERLAVRVAREAARGKNAVVEIVEPTAAEPGLLGRHRSDTQLIDAAPAPPEMRAALDAAFEAAAARTAPIPGGGRLVIEPTAALVAIDVDAADRAGSNDPEQFARDLNLAAAAEALRQIRLRDLGGVIAIDFVTLRSAKTRDEVMAALKAHSDPWGLSFAPMSRFGIVEMARPQLRRPLAEALCDATGALSTETQALAALRAAESAGRAEPARRVVLTVAPEIAAWLEAAPFEWKPALTARLGPRWRLETGALRGRAFDAHTE